MDGLHAFSSPVLTSAPFQLCLAHYCDVHGPTPMMVTEGLPVACSTCFDQDGPFDPVVTPDATSPSVTAITNALRHITSSPPHRTTASLDHQEPRPRRPPMVRSPAQASQALTSNVGPDSAIAADTPPASPDPRGGGSSARDSHQQQQQKQPHQSHTRRDSSFRKTYDEFVTKKAHPCDNCAMTLPRPDNDSDDNDDASRAAAGRARRGSEAARGPTLRTRAPYAWVFGGSGGESPPNSQPSSASDTDGEADDAATARAPAARQEGLRRSATGSTTTSRSSASAGGTPGSNAPAASHTHFVEYISTKEPLLPASFSVVRASCLRTLSFETLPRTPSSAAGATAISSSAVHTVLPLPAQPPPPTPPLLPPITTPPLLPPSSLTMAHSPGGGAAAAGSGGPIFFGDPAAGYTTAYIFRVPDVHARGHRRIYAFMALSTHGERVAMRTFGYVAAAFGELAGWIQALAEAEAERGAAEGTTATDTGAAAAAASGFMAGGGGGAFARRGHGGGGGGLGGAGLGNKVRQRGLAEVVGCPDFFIQLHIRFVRILRELGVKMNA